MVNADTEAESPHFRRVQNPFAKSVNDALSSDVISGQNPFELRCDISATLKAHAT